MLKIRKMENSREKAAIARGILSALPDWFGIPESVENYVRESMDMPFWAAFQEKKAVGFVAMKQTGAVTGEIFVMGVLPEFHRAGVGRQLVETLEAHAREAGCRYLQVKTVRIGQYEIYDRTNRFYMAMGFDELECFPQLWDESNPCQIYVKYIGGAL